MDTNFLVMEDIVKEFPGVRALDGVNLNVVRGKVLGLCGENGAGKSTLMKILSGVYPAREYQGKISIDGKLREFRGTKDAEESGVAIIHQELNLFKELTVAENIFIGNEIAHRGKVDWPAYFVEAGKLFEQYELDLDPRKYVKDLKIGHAQLIEITKALSKNARILVLDEPTSALTESEVAKLFQIMRKLKADGVTMFYISHKLDEIKAICDDVIVLRDGKSIGAPQPVAQMSKDDIVRAMVGRDIKTLYPQVARRPGSPALEVKNWHVDHPFLLGEHVVRDIHFSVKEGEIFGIYGLMGSGRTELLTSIFAGFTPDDYSGQLYIYGEAKRFKSPLDAINAGVALVTEDRKFLGLVLGLSVGDNVSLAALESLSYFTIVDSIREQQLIDRLIQELRIKTPTSRQLVRNLSGGNQQKVVLAKWLANKPRILFLDEPTRGVDIGAKVEIYNIMNKLKAEGVAIVMVTSELPELVGMSDTIMVMHEGQSAGIFDKEKVTVEKLGALATGNA